MRKRLPDRHEVQPPRADGPFAEDGQRRAREAAEAAPQIGAPVGGRQEQELLPQILHFE